MSPLTLRLAAPLFRFSTGRDAYVLRGVGNRMGPVLRDRRFARSAGTTVRDEHGESRFER